MTNNFINKILNYIYPTKCGFCGKITTSESFICNECRILKKQEYTNKCKFCGKFSLRKDICEECSNKKIYYEKLFFCMEYTKEIRERVHAYKFMGKKFYYNFFEELIRNKIIDINSDIIIAVPISKERYKERGYNQAGIIAKKLAKNLGIEYGDNILVKTRNNEKQSMQSFRKRQESIKNVFKVADNIKVKGRKVLLVDDIFTTGATANECCKLLKESGAKAIVVAVIAISHTLK